MKTPQSSLLALCLSATSILATPTREVSLNQRDTSGELNTHINLSLNEKIFPPKDSIIATFAKDLTAYCVGCTVIGDISFSGGGQDEFAGIGVDYEPDANFTKLPTPGFDVTDNWIGIAMDDFTVHLEIAIDLTPSGESNSGEWMVNMLPFPQKLKGLTIPDLLGLDISFEPQIHGWVNTSTAVNFTYGFDLTIPPGSAILIPIAHLEDIITVGFNETKITPTGLKSSTGDLEMSLELSYRPVYSLDLTIGSDTTTYNISTDIPKLDVKVSQVSNVDGSCNPTTSGKTFNNLTHIAPSLSMDIIVDLDGDVHEPFDPTGIQLPTNCLQYDRAAKTLSVPGSSGGVKGVLPAWGALLVSILGLVVFGG